MISDTTTASSLNKPKHPKINNEYNENSKFTVPTDSTNKVPLQTIEENNPTLNSSILENQNPDSMTSNLKNVRNLSSNNGLTEESNNTKTSPKKCISCLTAASDPKIKPNILPKTLPLTSTTQKIVGSTAVAEISKGSSGSGGSNPSTYQLQAQVHHHPSHHGSTSVQSSKKGFSSVASSSSSQSSSSQQPSVSSYHYLDQTSNCILEHDDEHDPEVEEKVSLSTSSSFHQSKSHISHTKQPQSSSYFHGSTNLTNTNPNQIAPPPHSPHSSISPTPSYGNPNASYQSSHMMGSSLVPGNPHPVSTSPHSIGSFQGLGGYGGGVLGQNPLGSSMLNGDLTPRGGMSRGDLCDERSPKSSISHLSLLSASFPCRYVQ